MTIRNLLHFRRITMKYLNQRKLHLKIKIKTLVEEAKIIRSFEEKFAWADEEKNEYPRFRLQEHRKGIVRNATRHNLLAYGCLRGVPYKKMEAKCKVNPDFDWIRRTAITFSSKYKKELVKTIDNWIQDAKDYLGIEK